MISYRPLSNENSALNTHSGDLFMASDSHCLARKLLGSFRTKDVTLVLEKSDYLKLGVSIIPAYLSFLIKMLYTYIVAQETVNAEIKFNINYTNRMQQQPHFPADFTTNDYDRLV